MASSGEPEAGSIPAKAKYHHGDLREALIFAVLKLVQEQGADNFSLADACRQAGVSTAAPYRHFRDRNEILAEVSARGFAMLNQMAAEAVERHGKGTQESITEMATNYVKFAVEQQGLFRLMFGQNPALTADPLVRETGRTCFGYLINHISNYCEANGFEGDVHDIALKLWTFVHGAASLLIDEKYETVIEALDVDRLIATATPSLLRQESSLKN